MPEIEPLGRGGAPEIGADAWDKNTKQCGNGSKGTVGARWGRWTSWGRWRWCSRSGWGKEEEGGNNLENAQTKPFEDV